MLASGTVDPGWPASGRALSPRAGQQYGPQIVSDGAGGAVVAWEDNRAIWTDVYAQHVLASGAVDPAWPAAGRALCTADGTQQGVRTVSDDAGGAIVTWSDRRGADADIYVQHVRLGGIVAPGWPSNGLALCTATNDQINPAIVADGAGGAIVVWQDARNPGTCDPFWGECGDIYAQHVTANGVVDVAWPVNGRALSTATSEQIYPQLVSDGSAGAIAVWQDKRNGADDIFAQRVRAEGNVDAAWPFDGRAVCAATGPQWAPSIVQDGAHGAVIVWEDYRGNPVHAYAQRISSGGAPQWTLNGVALCGAAGPQVNPRPLPDGSGGAVVAWEDHRAVPGIPDLYIGHVLSTGAVDPAWPVDGCAVSTADGEQKHATLVAAHAGAVIVAWTDRRSDFGDVYAQYVLANGQLGVGPAAVPAESPLALSLDTVRPNPAREGVLTVGFALAGAAPASLELIDVNGRRLESREVGVLGPGRHTLRLGQDRRLAPGLYLIRLRQGRVSRVTRAVVTR